MEDDVKINYKKNGRRPQNKLLKNGRRPQKNWKKMEDDLQKKLKTNQSTKINLIGCDTIVNSPSINYIWQLLFCPCIVCEDIEYQGCKRR